MTATTITVISSSVVVVLATTTTKETTTAVTATKTTAATTIAKVGEATKPTSNRTTKTRMAVVRADRNGILDQF